MKSAQPKIQQHLEAALEKGLGGLKSPSLNCRGVCISQPQILSLTQNQNIKIHSKLLSILHACRLTVIKLLLVPNTAFSLNSLHQV